MESSISALDEYYIDRMMHAAETLGIHGIGRDTAELLVCNMGIKQLWYLLRYNYRHDLELAGFQEAVVEQLYTEMEQLVSSVYDEELQQALQLPLTLAAQAAKYNLPENWLRQQQAVELMAWRTHTLPLTPPEESI